MPGKYFFKKWFFDLLTPEHDYVFLYFAFVNLLGKKIGTFDITVTNLHSNLSLHRSTPLHFSSEITDEPMRPEEESPIGDLEVDNEVRRIIVSGADFECSLEYGPRIVQVPESLEIARDRRSRIIWKPLALRSDVSGVVRVGSKELAVGEADGYADYLYSNVFPSRVPIHTLQWGRIHHDRIDIAYTIARSPLQKQTWAKLYARLEGKILQMTDLSIRQFSSKNCEELHLTYPDSYEVRGRSNGADITIRINHIANAAVSRFLDTEEIKNALGRWIVRKLSKDPNGIKFFAKANVEFTSPTGRVELNDVTCIDEFVQFDRF